MKTLNKIAEVCFSIYAIIALPGVVILIWREVLKGL